MVMEFIQMMDFWIVLPCHSDNKEIIMAYHFSFMQRGNVYGDEQEVRLTQNLLTVALLRSNQRFCPYLQ
jgi:hypothetical protein